MRKIFIYIVGIYLVIISISSVSYYQGMHKDDVIPLFKGIPKAIVEALIYPVILKINSLRKMIFSNQN